MKNSDFENNLREKVTSALEGNDVNGLTDALYELAKSANDADVDSKIEELREELDRSVLAQRGARQLTVEEKNYYGEVLNAMRSKNPKQAIENLDLALPITVVNSVFDELRTEHPLLSRVDFIATAGIDRVLMDTTEYQKAGWGELCEDILKELSAGLKVVNANLYKLSAFLVVCKPGMELGPDWLDNYVRQVLYEALANGFEAGIINGTGDDEPIGMNRQVGEGVTVVDGVYPVKPTITVTDFSKASLAPIMSALAVDGAGKPRRVRDLILIVNPLDYFAVEGATSILAPDGSYRSVMPYGIELIQSNEVPAGKAILGIASRYLATAAISREGRIEYSDEYKFVEDKRVYIIKTYGNGMPKDNNAFVYLDISNIEPTGYPVTVRGTVSTVEVPPIGLDQPSAATDLFGKSVTDLQSGVVISNGVISGTLKYVEDYTAAGYDMSKGHNFLALHFVGDASATTVIEHIGGENGPKTLDSDNIFITQISNKNTQIKVTTTVSGATNTVYYSLAGLKLAKE